MIEVSGISTSLKKNRILNDISFKVRPGEFVALVGPNGAGKTTLLKHLNGLLKPDSGSVTVCGRDTRKSKTSELARLVGFLFQNPDQQILCQTVRDEISFGLKYCGIPHDEWEDRIRESASLVALGDKLDADPLLLTRSRRQRVALASVLATEPSVLVLDEPTSAQDESETIRIMEVAEAYVARGNTVILVSHDMDLVARYAKRILLLVKGKIEADCTPAEFFTQKELLVRAHLVEPGVFALASALGYPEASIAESLTVEALADFVCASNTRETL
jgi:energy-coupling factor transport system ATP-binding protein